ncbi:hypothetical protein BKA70DRAFT_1327363 [Coprinopsis sp. MPI-PUGE-AT-0042]|nr:hypothetical protein BKA70DRAFT_1327363 [Coprinopsis sp. MPI-PUGE-AT-0042]
MSDIPLSPSGVVMFDRTTGQNFGHSNFSAAGRDHINLNIHLATGSNGHHLPITQIPESIDETRSLPRAQPAAQHPSLLTRVCQRFRNRSRRRPRTNVQVPQEPDNVVPCPAQTAKRNQPPPGPPPPSPSSDAVVLSDGSSVSSFDSCSPSSPVRYRVSGEEEVYERALLPKGQGFPLFNPPPLDKPVRFGDFGILGQDGFETFGNLFDPNDQQEFSLSNPPQYDARRHPRKLQEGQVVASGIEDARRLQDGDQKSTNRFEFRCRETQGAALALTSSGDLESLTPKSRNQLREYLCNHGTQLVKQLRRRHYLEPNQSLYVVTGTIKSDSWAIAVHTSPMREPYDQMVLTKREGNPGADLPTHEWSSWGSADARCGASDAIDEDGGRARDQCLFLRGFLLTPSADLERQSTLDTDDGSYGGASDSSSDSSHAKDTGHRTSRKGDRSSRTQQNTHDSDQNNASSGGSLQYRLRGPLETRGLVQPFPTGLPSDSKHYYPSRCLNASLLAVKNMDLAITHDDDWRHKIPDGYLDDEVLSAFTTEFWRTNIPVVTHGSATTLPITASVQDHRQGDRPTMQKDPAEMKLDDLDGPIFVACAIPSRYIFPSEGTDRDKIEHPREPDKESRQDSISSLHLPEFEDDTGPENHWTTTKDWTQEPPAIRGPPCGESKRPHHGLELTQSSGSGNDPEKRRGGGVVHLISDATVYQLERCEGLTFAQDVNWSLYVGRDFYVPRGAERDFKDVPLSFVDAEFDQMMPSHPPPISRPARPASSSQNHVPVRKLPVIGRTRASTNGLPKKRPTRERLIQRITQQALEIEALMDQLNGAVVNEPRLLSFLDFILPDPLIAYAHDNWASDARRGTDSDASMAKEAIALRGCLRPVISTRDPGPKALRSKARWDYPKNQWGASAKASSNASPRASPPVATVLGPNLSGFYLQSGHSRPGRDQGWANQRKQGADKEGDDARSVGLDVRVKSESEHCPSTPKPFFSRLCVGNLGWGRPPPPWMGKEFPVAFGLATIATPSDTPRAFTPVAVDAVLDVHLEGSSLLSLLQFPSQRRRPSRRKEGQAELTMMQPPDGSSMPREASDIDVGAHCKDALRVAAQLRLCPSAASPEALPWCISLDFNVHQRFQDPIPVWDIRGFECIARPAPPMWRPAQVLHSGGAESVRIGPLADHSQHLLAHITSGMLRGCESHGLLR